MLPGGFRFRDIISLALRKDGGPTRTRTWDQWIHVFSIFLSSADYLITLGRFRLCRWGAGRSCLSLRALGVHRTPSPR